MVAEPIPQVAVRYKYLEPKPYKKWTKQLGIKGRNMLVWHLVAVMRTEGYTIEEAARNYDLPVEAVCEALAYFEDNKDWILEENERVGRELGVVA